MKIKDKDRLIARMILGIGLSLTIASGVACGITHPKLSDVKNEYRDAKENKDAYLEVYEQTDEFKTAYNDDVKALNDRLIAREIDGNTYDKELENLTNDTYTEQVLLANANEQTKAEFNEINQKYLDAENNWNNSAMPFYLSSMGSFIIPAFTYVNYYMWKPSKKQKREEQNPTKIAPEIMKRVMQIDDTPYHGDIKRRVEIVHDEKLGVLRAVENQPNTEIPNVPRSVDACIIKLEEETQENENRL